MLIVEEAMHVWGQGPHGEPLYLSFKFSVNLKAVLKNCLQKRLSQEIIFLKGRDRLENAGTDIQK